MTWAVSTLTPALLVLASPLHQLLTTFFRNCRGDIPFQRLNFQTKELHPRAIQWCDTQFGRQWRTIGVELRGEPNQATRTKKRTTSTSLFSPCPHPENTKPSKPGSSNTPMRWAPYSGSAAISTLTSTATGISPDTCATWQDFHHILHKQPKMRSRWVFFSKKAIFEKINGKCPHFGEL